MIIKRFSATKIISTTTAPGFIKGRKYDTDLDRLGRSSTQREISELRGLNFDKELKEAKKKAKKDLEVSGNTNQELRKMRKELDNGRNGKWQYTD